MIAGVKDTDWLRTNPLHPGTHIKVGYLDACGDYPGMTIEAAAAKLGVSRVTLSRIVNGRRPVKVDLAMKLEAAGMGIADAWLAHQTRWDLAQARKRLQQPLAEAPARVRAEQLPAEDDEAVLYSNRRMSLKAGAGGLRAEAV